LASFVMIAQVVHKTAFTRFDLVVFPVSFIKIAQAVHETSW